MAWYAVYDSETGALRSVGSVVADPLPEGLEAREYEERPTGVWDAGELDFVPREERPPRLPRVEFMRLFTREERVAIRRSDDPVVADFHEMLMASDEVDMGHADVQEGVGYLVSEGYLTSERGEQILAGEAPDG